MPTDGVLAKHVIRNHHLQPWQIFSWGWEWPLNTCYHRQILATLCRAHRQEPKAGKEEGNVLICHREITHTKRLQGFKTLFANSYPLLSQLQASRSLFRGRNVQGWSGLMRNISSSALCVPHPSSPAGGDLRPGAPWWQMGDTCDRGTLTYWLSVLLSAHFKHLLIYPGYFKSGRRWPMNICSDVGKSQISKHFCFPFICFFLACCPIHILRTHHATHLPIPFSLFRFNTNNLNKWKRELVLLL